MAFSAHEVRVLRRALAVALRGGRDSVDFWLLGRAIGEAQDERERLRAFMTAELRRYRAALPGSAAGFLSCLRNAVDEIAHVPSAEDLAALRTTLDLPCGERERASRAALLRRCTHLAEADLEHRLAARAHRRATAEATRAIRTDPLDILIPTRPRPARPSPTPAEHKRDRTPEPTPVPVPVPASEPEPRPVLAEAPVEQATDPTGPEATDDAMDSTDVANGADPAVGTDVTDGTDEIVGRAVEDPPEAEPEPQAEPEAEHEHGSAPDAPASPEPEGAEVATDRDAGNSNATDAPTPDPAPAAVPPLDVDPIREALSPVIPHRRQGRPLGQLPAPEILQTGTG